MAINPEKSTFFQNKISLLGHIIKEGKMITALTKFNANKLEVVPQTKTELKKLLGSLNWFREYIPRLSELLYPLYEKLKEPIIKRNRNDEQMLLKIRQEIERQQELAISDPSQEFALFTYASNMGISSILTQKSSIIRLFSHKLSDVQSRYTIVEKECLVIVESLRRFKPLIGTTHVKINTDNKNLTFESLKNTSIIQRWKTLLNEFSHKLLHKSANKNQGADWLSRNFIIKTQQPPFDLTHYSNGETDEKNRVIIQPENETDFLIALHQWLGHPGQFKLARAINKFYNIRKANELIKKVCSECLPCARNKIFARKEGYVSGFLKAEWVGERTSSDIFGPIDGSKYNEESKFWLVTFTGILSRFTIVRVLRESSGSELAKIFTKERTPLFKNIKCLISNRGSQYTSQSMRQACTKLGIKQYFTSPYNPTANSVSEHVN